MQTPFKFRYNGEPWTINLVRTIKTDDGDTRDLYGHCDYERRLIRLSEEQPIGQLLPTLLHEILHMVFPNGIVGAATEEKIVNGLEKPLLHALTTLKWVDPHFTITRKVPLKTRGDLNL